MKRIKNITWKNTDGLLGFITGAVLFLVPFSILWVCHYLLDGCALEYSGLGFLLIGAVDLFRPITYAISDWILRNYPRLIDADLLRLLITAIFLPSLGAILFSLFGKKWGCAILMVLYVVLSVFWGLITYMMVVVFS